MKNKKGNIVVCPVNKDSYIGWPPESDILEVVEKALIHVDRMSGSKYGKN